MKGTTMKILSYDELKPKGILHCKSQLWRLEKIGKFPKRVTLSPMRHGWPEDEIDAWILERIAERDRKVPPGKRGAANTCTGGGRLRDRKPQRPSPRIAGVEGHYQSNH
jgi:prophage regulatory protein